MKIKKRADVYWVPDSTIPLISCYNRVYCNIAQSGTSVKEGETKEDGYPCRFVSLRDESAHHPTAIV